MPRGLALITGLNSVDPEKYAGWNGELHGCENDAEDMAMVVNSHGFEIMKLLTKDATCSNFERSIKQAAKILNDGDIFLISFSGHGGQMQDIDSDEKDFLDSTWVFYDRQLTDDELENLIRTNFTKQVRILIISSAAHAGAAYMGRLINKKNQKSVSSAMKDMSPDTPRLEPELHITKPNKYNENLNTEKLNQLKNQTNSQQILEKKNNINHLSSNRQDLLHILQRENAEDRELKTPIIIFTGCEKNELDTETEVNGRVNGAFSYNMLKVMRERNFNFKGTYKQFYKEILKLSSLSSYEQHPQYYVVGKLDKKFENQAPFTI